VRKEKGKGKKRGGKKEEKVRMWRKNRIKGRSDL
jgi:hypothetical protein